MSDSHLMEGALGRLISYSGLALASAPLAWRFFTGNPVHSREAARPCVGWGAVALTLGAFTALFIACLNLTPGASEGPQNPWQQGAQALEALGPLMRETTYGRWWIAHALSVGVCAAFVATKRENHRIFGIALLGVSLTLVSLGHGGAQGFVSTLFLLSWQHLFFAIVWLGAVIQLVTLKALPGNSPTRDELTRFSKTAQWVFPLALFTGVVRATEPWGAGAFGPWSRYGVLVVIKVVVVVILSLLANRLRLRVKHEYARNETKMIEPGSSNFDDGLAWEVAAAALVLVLTAMLAQLEPGTGA